MTLKKSVSARMEFSKDNRYTVENRWNLKTSYMNYLKNITLIVTGARSEAGDAKIMCNRDNQEVSIRILTV